MELKLTRKIRTYVSTIGILSIDGVQECYTLEDLDRGLKQSQPLAEIKANKVFGKTCIPAGRYEVILNYSNKYKRFMPLLLNVMGFEGIRIHSGNKAEDTEGCILLGSGRGADWISSSREAVAAFMTKLEAAIKTQKVYITIE
ncbi:hypothetical protein GCM10023149_30790 [Mucilaginibacter gynuensis]|uniref:DUF5675 domain-containing protein n=1 Tax=Mucilaginibacter gynuensis TaxID=1302236 RepID=A0ABP8GND4_9SPHI